MAQITAWMKSVFNKRNAIHFLGLSRVSHQAQNKPLPFDSGQTSKATDSVESPELYLSRATKCMEEVKEVIIGGVSTKLKLNRIQCEYLVEKLETTVASCTESFSRSSSPEHKAECFESLKLLYQLSTEVERFIQDCCEDTWMQSALLWESMPVRVTSLGYYLELCTELLRNNNKLGSALLVCAKLEDLSQVELQSVKKKALLDRSTLIESLIALSRNVLTEESQRAKIILARLTSKEAPKAMETASSSPSSQSSFSIANSGITEIKSLKLLGKGSSGSVFKGMWMGAEVAVRTTHGHFANLFRKELDILASLSHPNIVNGLGYCQGDRGDDISVILELMDEDLSSLINGRNFSHSDGEGMKTPFTIAEAVDLMLQVAEGVNYLHQNKIIHGDLKSNHILVKHIKGKEAKITAKVTDIWKVKNLQRDITTLLNAARPANRWTAPELLIENSLVSELLRFKSDVYSFAMLCYEILTGDVPFSNISKLHEVQRRVLEGGRPTLPAQCPEDLKSLIKICWASDAEQRPFFSEICEELRYLKCLTLLEPFNQIQTHQQDQPIAILDLPGLSHLKIELSHLHREMQLGKGGSETTVYSGYWHQSNMVQHLIAQKRFIGANNEEFKKEITILSTLKHPNVVCLFGYAIDTRSCSIIMEKMDGDLYDLIHQRRFQGHSIQKGVFSMDEAIFIMLQIAQGMLYIHLQNVAHRDLKTCNILVQNNGLSVKDLCVKVADFGVSKKKSEASNFERVSDYVGTLRWMAPEIFKNGEDTHIDSRNYDLFKCDVYSFAMVCFEILTGNVPFADINLEGFLDNQDLPLKGLKHGQIEVLKKIVLGGERPQLPKSCPPKLETLIKSCWNGDAKARPSFGEICVELRGLLNAPTTQGFERHEEN